MRLLCIAAVAEHSTSSCESSTHNLVLAEALGTQVFQTSLVGYGLLMFYSDKLGGSGLVIATKADVYICWTVRSILSGFPEA